jgi:hypothetical protein
VPSYLDTLTTITQKPMIIMETAGLNGQRHNPNKAILTTAIETHTTSIQIHTASIQIVCVLHFGLGLEEG